MNTHIAQRPRLRPSGSTFARTARFFLLGGALLPLLNGGHPASAATPPGTPPTGVAGKWSYGTFSPTSFWGKDGTHSGAAYEQAMAFHFGPDDTYEQYVINVTNYYGCRTAAYTLYKGKTRFNEAEGRMELIPTQGTQRGEYSCYPGKNFKRPATDSEITRMRKTVRYVRETDAKGQPALHLYFDANDQQGMRLTQGRW